MNTQDQKLVLEALALDNIELDTEKLEYIKMLVKIVRYERLLRVV